MDCDAGVDDDIHSSGSSSRNSGSSSNSNVAAPVRRAQSSFSGVRPARRRRCYGGGRTSRRRPQRLSCCTSGESLKRRRISDGRKNGRPTGAGEILRAFANTGYPATHLIVPISGDQASGVLSYALTGAEKGASAPIAADDDDDDRPLAVVARARWPPRSMARPSLTISAQHAPPASL
uniref:Uncharacterized protein n=1 Tax=Plectus sambesii TaxID=2011161 RepID=A0A914UL57_9BILA